MLTSLLQPSAGSAFVTPESLLLVVIRHLHLVSITATPDEAHAELIVDLYAVLAFPIALQLLKMVARRGAQILDALRGVNHQQLLPRPPLQIGGYGTHVLAVPKPFRVFVGEALYHDGIILTRPVNNVKR